MIDVDKIQRNMQLIIEKRGYLKDGEAYALKKDSFVLWGAVVELLTEYRNTKKEPPILIERLSEVYRKIGRVNTKYDSYLKKMQSLGYDVLSERMEYANSFTKNDMELRNEASKLALKNVFLLIDKCNNGDDKDLLTFINSLDMNVSRVMMHDSNYIKAVIEKYNIKANDTRDFE